MGYGGQVLNNPVTGERFVFHATSDDTAGELLEFDVVVEPNGPTAQAAVLAHPAVLAHRLITLRG